MKQDDGDFALKIIINFVAYGGMIAFAALIAYAFVNAAFVSGEWSLL